MNCFNCAFFDNSNPVELDGVCKYSMRANHFMEAHDDMQEFDPYLAVSEQFYCNCWAEKEL